jgi:hypothetical protein
MNNETKPLTEITEDALRILYRELGVVNTVRFLNQFMTGLGDYTQERAETMGNETVEELVEAIERQSRMASTK